MQRSIDLTILRSCDLQIQRPSDFPILWSSDLQTHQSSYLLIYRPSILWGYRSNDPQMYLPRNLLIHQSSDLQTQGCSELHMYRSIDLPIHRSSDIQPLKKLCALFSLEKGKKQLFLHHPFHAMLCRCLRYVKKTTTPKHWGEGTGEGCGFFCSLKFSYLSTMSILSPIAHPTHPGDLLHRYFHSLHLIHLHYFQGLSGKILVPNLAL